MISFHPYRVRVDDPIDCERAAKMAKGYGTLPVNNLHQVAKIALKFMWSGISWHYGHRIQHNFKSAHYCLMDFDGNMELDEALRIFCDCQHIIGVTRNHRVDKNGVIADRFRVVIPFEKPITDLRVYRYNMQKLKSKHDLDRSTLDGARFFFPCREIVSIKTDGFSQEVDENVSDNFESYVTDRARAETDSGVLSSWTRSKIKTKIPKGERNTTIFRMAKDLARIGHSVEEIVELIHHFKCVEDLKTEDFIDPVRNGVKAMHKEAEVVREKDGSENQEGGII